MSDCRPVTAEWGRRGACWLASAQLGLSDLFLGLACLGCQRLGTAWCDECVRTALAPSLTELHHGRLVASAAEYGGAVQRALIAHKERGQLVLARPLGVLLSEAVRLFPTDGAVTLIPCPSTPRAIRVRGQDHARRVTLRAVRELVSSGRGAECRSVIEISRGVVDQVGLTAAERTANLAGAFVAKRPRRQDRRAIIVDDVTTTGSTLDEAWRALTASGWSVIGAAVVARAGPRTGVADPASLG